VPERNDNSSCGKGRVRKYAISLLAYFLHPGILARTQYRTEFFPLASDYLDSLKKLLGMEAAKEES